MGFQWCREDAGLVQALELRQRLPTGAVELSTVKLLGHRGASWHLKWCLILYSRWMPNTVELDIIIWSRMEYVQYNIICYNII